MLFKGNLRWILIFWMFLMSSIAYLDRVNISIAGSEIQKSFGLTNVQLGYVFSAFVVGYALFQAPGGRLSDRFGPRLIIMIGVLWWSLFTTFTTMVPAGLGISIMMLVIVRFLLGIGEAVVYPASNRLTAAWIPSGERGVANGFIFAGVGAGAGITPPLITFVLLHWGWFGQNDWVWAMGVFFPTFFLLLGESSMYQKFFSAKDEASARKAVIGMVIWVVILETLLCTLAVVGSAKYFTVAPFAGPEGRWTKRQPRPSSFSWPGLTCP